MADNGNKTADFDAKAMIDDLVAKAKTALDEYMKLDQEQVDKITNAMSLAGLSAQIELAKMAVEETGRGIFEGHKKYFFHRIYLALCKI